MQVPSLQRNILSSLSIEKLRKLCFGEENTFQGAFDCSWDLWREKAYIDLAIPYQYFDLPRNFALPYEIAGINRYIQIAAMIKLSDLSSIKVYSNGFIQGVYEKLALVEEALLRNDKEMLLKAVYKLGIKQKELLGSRKKYTYSSFMIENNNALACTTLLDYLGKTVQITPFYSDGEDNLNAVISLYKELEMESYLKYGGKLNSHSLDLQYLVSFGSIEAFDMIRETAPSRLLLKYSLQSGRHDLIEIMIKKFFTGLPEDFSIDSYVPEIPFMVINERNYKVTDYFPLVNFTSVNFFNRYVDTEQYLDDAILSGNVKVVDLIRSLLVIPEIAEDSIDYIVNSYKKNKNPVACYSILQRVGKITDLGNLNFLIVENELPDYNGVGLQIYTTNADLFLLALNKTEDNINEDFFYKAIIRNLGNIPFLRVLLEVYTRRYGKVNKNMLYSYYPSVLFSSYPLSWRLIEEYSEK